MTYGSLFSGAGGVDIGFDAAGLSCAFQCEIDRTANEVLRHRWPDVPKHRDITKVKRKHLPKVDVLVGGFPCQDLSVAGNRGGLAGERSGLFYELARIANEIRPGLLVWENVPGLLSSDDGRDFARVLRHLADIGYFGVWRVLDAQYFGVPQQRRRVFGVFARGRFGIDRCAEILALAEGVRGDPPTRREAGSVVAALTANGVGTCGADDSQAQAGHIVFGGGDTRGERRRDATLTTENQRNDFDSENFVLAFNCKDDGGGRVSPTLRAMGHANSHANAGGQVAVCVTGQKTHALTSEGADASEDGTGRGTPIIFLQNQRDEIRTMPFPGALQAQPGMKQQPFVFQANDYKNGTFEERITARPLTTSADRSRAAPVTTNNDTVRRLTPRECERLQGWPDDHTRYGDGGREIADGPRYRMVGNGVAAPVATWIGRRIMESR